MQKLQLSDLPQAGVITSKSWLYAPDGDQYRAIWCRYWVLVTDTEFPKANFRSAERWAVFAYEEGKVVAIIPGCDVAGYMACEKPPVSITTWKIGY